MALMRRTGLMVLSRGQIYSLATFIHIHTKGTFTHETLKAYKSLEAYNYFYNGYVQPCLSLLAGISDSSSGPHVCSLLLHLFLQLGLSRAPLCSHPYLHMHSFNFHSHHLKLYIIPCTQSVCSYKSKFSFQYAPAIYI